MKRPAALVVGAALLAGTSIAGLPAGAAVDIEKSDTIKRVGGVRFQGGTELAAIGGRVFAGQLDGGAEAPSRGTAPDRGGFHILDVTGKVKEIGALNCPGNDNDVEVVNERIVALGFHVNRCAPAAGNGFMLVDVKNPRKPRIVGMVATNKNHTFKPLPGTNYIYTAGASLSGGPAAGPAVVDVSNPRKPEVVARPQTITMDCHDISFWVGKEGSLGFCAGAVGTGEVQIWDVTDPLAPETIGRIVNPLIQYSHYAVASSDGQVLAIDDEAFAAHDCNTGMSPTGRVWLYDISNPAVPLLQGSYAPPRGGSEETFGIGNFVGWVPSWCLSHGLDWAPGTRYLAVTWFTGGLSVLDVSDPTAPVEHAYWRASDSTTYSALWHGGRLYTNDMTRGVDAFEVKGVKPGR